MSENNWKDMMSSALAAVATGAGFTLLVCSSAFVGMLVMLLLLQSAEHRTTVTEAVLPDGSRIQVTARRLEEATSYLDADGREVVRIEKYTVYRSGEKEGQP